MKKKKKKMGGGVRPVSKSLSVILNNTFNPQANCFTGTNKVIRYLVHFSRRIIDLFPLQQLSSRVPPVTVLTNGHEMPNYIHPPWWHRWYWHIPCWWLRPWSTGSIRKQFALSANKAHTTRPLVKHSSTSLLWLPNKSSQSGLQTGIIVSGVHLRGNIQCKVSKQQQQQQQQTVLKDEWPSFHLHGNKEGKVSEVVLKEEWWLAYLHRYKEGKVSEVVLKEERLMAHSHGYKEGKVSLVALK